MKLRTKLIMISLAVTLAVLIAGLFSFHVVQESSLRQTDRINTRQSLLFFCTNVVSVVQTDTTQNQDVTLRSIVSYYFSTYARLLSGSRMTYALVQDDQYLFSNCPIDVHKSLSKNCIVEAPLLTDVRDGRAEIPQDYDQIDDNNLLVAACSFQISSQIYQAFICVDVTKTTLLINQMRWLSVLIMFTAMIIVITLMMIVLPPVLKPVQKLTQTATLISSGDYHQRTSIRTRDEIGALSYAFDCMADSIEDKIQSLDDQLQKKAIAAGRVDS